MLIWQQIQGASLCGGEENMARSKQLCYGLESWLKFIPQGLLSVCLLSARHLNLELRRNPALLSPLLSCLHGRRW